MNLEEKLVLSDSLHWFDQVRGDGVCKAMPLLDFLLSTRQNRVIKVQPPFFPTINRATIEWKKDKGEQNVKIHCLLM